MLENNLDKWSISKQVVAAIIGALVAAMTTLQTLGMRVTCVEVELKTMSKQLDRMETVIDRLEQKRGERLPADRGH